jgi:hypothetical protein
VDAAHAVAELGREHAVQVADFLVEIARQVPAEVRRFIELVQRPGCIDAAADDLGILLAKFVCV